MNRNKVAVVTGGASGIGKAVVAKLVSSGFPTAFLDLKSGTSESLETDVAANGTRVAFFRADVTDFKALRNVAEQVTTELGPPSIVVNCAGWSEIQPFLKNDEAFWRKAVDINLMGTINVTRVFLDKLINSGGGSVINIASDAGRVGSTGEVVYAAAKGGVIAFTKALAREMARHKINVNCICPGPTATPMLLVQDSKRIEALTNAIPMRRLAEPEDIANAVLFFASPNTSYVTGQVLSVSGGLTMSG